MQTHSDNIFKYAINSFYTQTFHLSRCYKEPLKGMIFFIFSVEPPRICFNLYAEGDIDCNPFYPIYKKPNELISMAINGDLVLHLCRSLRLRTIPVVASGSVLQLPFPHIPNSLPPQLSPFSMRSSLRHTEGQASLPWFCHSGNNTRSKMVY